MTTFNATFQSTNNAFNASFGTTDMEFMAMFDSVINVVDLDTYSGPYTVRSVLNENLTIPTNGKLMAEDMTIGKIPVVYTSNLFDGKTVVIG